MEYELLDNGYTRLKVPKRQFEDYKTLIISYIMAYGGQCVKESSRFIYYIVYTDLINRKK